MLVGHQMFGAFIYTMWRHHSLHQKGYILFFVLTALVFISNQRYWLKLLILALLYLEMLKTYNGCLLISRNDSSVIKVQKATDLTANMIYPNHRKPVWVHCPCGVKRIIR